MINTSIYFMKLKMFLFIYNIFLCFLLILGMTPTHVKQSIASKSALFFILLLCQLLKVQSHEIW